MRVATIEEYSLGTAQRFEIILGMPYYLFINVFDHLFYKKYLPAMCRLKKNKKR